MNIEKFEDLKNHVILAVNVNYNTDDGDEIIFTIEGGEKYRLFHSQDCCEDVFLEDICGRMEELIGSVNSNGTISNWVTLADVVSSDDEGDIPDRENEDPQDSYTWTFYKLSTNQGSVTIRWYGTSNGYYSEEVDWEKVK